MVHAVRRLARIVRWRAWGDSKLPVFVMVMAWGAEAARMPAGAALPRMAGLVVLLSLYAAFGHVVNDVADRDMDRAAGKPTAAGALPAWAAQLLLAGTGLGACAVAWAGFGLGMLVWTLAALGLAAGYSLRPVRLKERGLVGWLSAALAQRTLPAVIALQPFGVWDAGAWGLLAFSTAIGLRFIIVHQLGDRAADLRAGTRTLAAEQDPAVVRRVLYWVFGAELVSLAATVAAMAAVAPPIAVSAMLYAGWTAASGRRRARVSPLVVFTLYGFVCVVWPLTLALLLSWRDPAFLAAAAFLVALVARRAFPPPALPRAAAVPGPGPSRPDAVRRGVAALAAMQGADGSFPLWTGTTAWSPCGPLFSTAYVLMAAGHLLPAEASGRAAAFIRQARRADGLWEFDPALGIPPDADSTACALAALARFGRAADLVGGAALLRGFWRAGGGPFRTWREAGWSGPERDDAVANCHVVLALGLCGAPASGDELRAVSAFVAATVRPRYYHAPASLALAAMRAGLPASVLNASAAAMPPGDDPLSCAEWLAGGGRDGRAEAAVLAAQGGDGSWPGLPWITAEETPRPFWGSPSASTALALECLAGPGIGLRKA